VAGHKLTRPSDNKVVLSSAMLMGAEHDPGLPPATKFLTSTPVSSRAKPSIVECHFLPSYCLSKAVWHGWAVNDEYFHLFGPIFAHVLLGMVQNGPIQLKIWHLLAKLIGFKAKLESENVVSIMSLIFGRGGCLGISAIGALRSKVQPGRAPYMNVGSFVGWTDLP